MISAATNGFRRLCLSTLVAVYILIFVGGVVRTTGSGMGCPDWPKCFGSWVPPTSVDQLPANYKENYSAYRDKKNQKFVNYLRLMGMNNTADKILADKSILTETEFNPIKTRIEYFNRLVGVTVGLLIVFLFLKSLSFRKEMSIVFWVSLATLVSVVFQGWFGSIVVSTNLTTWTITVHFFLALLIVGLLVWLLHRTKGMHVNSHPTTRRWLMAALVLQIIQIFFGTEVREAIDLLALSLPRTEWVDSLGSEFIVHRSFSWLVLLINGIFFLQVRKTIGLKTLSLALFLLILCSLITGVGMAYFEMPATLQPVHLVIATIVFGLQLLLIFRMHPELKPALK